MNTVEQKTRIEYFDALKGLLIFLVVLGHVMYELPEKVAENTALFIYIFHMPAFVFISGYFGKGENSESKVSLFWLLFLYFVFNSWMGFVYGFGSLIVPVYSNWYLLALVVWRVTAKYVCKIRKVELVLFAVALFIGFFPSVDNSFALSRIISFYLFYILGLKHDKQISKKKIIILLLLAVILSTVLFKYSFLTFDILQMYPYDDPKTVFTRILVIFDALAIIYLLVGVYSRFNIKFLSGLGKNSLIVFLFHRPLTLVVNESLKGLTPIPVIIISVLASCLICLLLGNSVVAKFFGSFKNSIECEFSGGKCKIASNIGIITLCGYIGILLMKTYTGAESITELAGDLHDTSTVETEQTNEDPIYNTLSEEKKTEFDNAFRITFSGDLILLEDQVKRGLKNGKYDFDNVFFYAKDYISSADYAIGVFEGPMAGKEAGYSTSNFNDSKTLALNFPDEFAAAVKNAGFDLVTTANNHLLDKGEEGALRTLKVLDEVGLEHTGSYRNDEEKDNIKIIEKEGIRIAVLSYTYGSNNYDNGKLLNGKLSYITSVICGTEGAENEKCLSEVREDFEKAKLSDPDLIMVLPHIGTQFTNVPDNEQKVWFKNFEDLGADIILGDHPHVVQPTLIKTCNGHDVFETYCPGNFANIYREQQGDTSVLVDVYIDRSSKSVIGGAIIPLYTYAENRENYKAVPIYKIFTDDTVSISTDDYKRANDANKLITKIVFGHEMDITSVTERYYFDKSGFLRTKMDSLKLNDAEKGGLFFREINKAQSVCFIGDSVTQGTKNGGCPWYEPLEKYMKNIYNRSYGGYTIKRINEDVSDIPSADLFVVAIGTNDVRYRDKEVCAMNAEEYIEETEKLTGTIRNKNKNAHIIFIAPWYSTDADPYCVLSYEDKLALNEEYSTALKTFCDNKGLIYIDPNPYIRDVLDKDIQSKYMLDHIHPNASLGIKMYSKAVLNYG